MLLTEDQKFFLTILQETSCVRADHVLPLLHLQFPDKTQYQADAMLRTLRYQGKVVPGEDNIIRLAERRSAPPCRSPDRSSAPAECFMRAYTAKRPGPFGSGRTNVRGTTWIRENPHSAAHLRLPCQRWASAGAY